MTTSVENVEAPTDSALSVASASLRLPRDTLFDSLRLVSGVVETAQILPILSHVKITAQGNTLTVTATDSEVELIAQASLPEPANFSATVSGRKLVDICRTLPSDAWLDLSVAERWLTLKTAQSRFQLTTMPCESFPQIELGAQTAQIQIPERELMFLLSRTSFAMGQQDVRYFLNGIQLTAEGEQARSVATDGHRLAMNTLSKLTLGEQSINVIIPRKGVIELTRLLNDQESAVNIVVTPNHLRVSGEKFTFTSNLLEGKYPDVQQLLPRGSDKQVVLSRDLLRQALQRAAILTSDKFRGVRFEFADNQLKVKATNTEQEQAEEVLVIEYSAEPLVIAFNINYLVDILSVVDTGAVVMALSTPENSVLITEHESLHDTAFVVMPLTI